MKKLILALALLSCNTPDELIWECEAFYDLTITGESGVIHEGFDSDESWRDTKNEFLEFEGTVSSARREEMIQEYGIGDTLSIVRQSFPSYIRIEYQLYRLEKNELNCK